MVRLIFIRLTVICSKLQMQLAIIKKKELDAKAQTIVERLLEPDVDSGWMLENVNDLFKFILSTNYYYYKAFLNYYPIFYWCCS